MTKSEMRRHGLNPKNYNEAKTVYEKLLTKIGADDHILEIPSEDDIEGILDCITAGYLSSIYEQVSKGKYVHAIQPGVTTLRQISRSSLFYGQDMYPRIVAGEPRNIEVPKGKKF